MDRKRWNSSGPPGTDDPFDLAIHAARLIGADPDLVLHGGGNTSFKSGRGDSALLHVKGSGADLATVTRDDYVTLRLAPVRDLVTRPGLDNAGLYPALAPSIVGNTAARPSIETLMHAGLDAPHAIHTHAAAVLALSNCVEGERHLSAALGGRAALVPYRHSGADLARACMDAQARKTPTTTGLVLMHHGAVAWGDDAGEAYERMLWLADTADAYLDAHGATDCAPAAADQRPLTSGQLLRIAGLRARACAVAGHGLIARFSRDTFAQGLLDRTDLADFSLRGPSTPGHAIHTKRHPLIGDAVEAFARDYRVYLGDAGGIDCAPRIVLDGRTGMLALGVTARHARIAEEIFRHDARIMLRAQAMGGYRTIAAEAMRSAEVEYAGFEARVAAGYPRAGQVHLIDRARDRADTVDGLLKEGAAVIAIDAPEGFATSDACLPLPPVRATEDVATTLEAAVRAFGGIDACVADRALAAACQPFLDLAHV